MHLDLVHTAGDLRLALRGVPDDTLLTTNRYQRRKLNIGYGTDPTNTGRRIVVIDLKPGEVENE